MAETAEPQKLGTPNGAASALKKHRGRWFRRIRMGHDELSVFPLRRHAKMVGAAGFPVHGFSAYSEKFCVIYNGPCKFCNHGVAWHEIIVKQKENGSCCILRSSIHRCAKTHIDLISDEA